MNNQQLVNNCFLFLSTVVSVLATWSYRLVINPKKI